MLKGSLLARALGWRNRRLADPAFQRWAAAFPLTRPIARAQAGELFDIVAGFVWSQTLFACVELGVFDALAEGPRGDGELAAALGLPVEATTRLIRAATALGLLARVGEATMLGQKGAALLGNPGVLAMVRHHARLYADLADPVALLRRGGGGGALARYWPYAGGGAGGGGGPGAGGGDNAVATATYSALMAGSQPMIAAQAIAAYDFGRHRRVLDVGGGTGAFLAAIGARWPALELALFDLPEVIAARETGEADRVTATGGDMFEGPLPSGADLVTLVRVLHDHEDPAVAALLRHVRVILPQVGRLLIVEPMSATPGARRVGDAYFGWYLLAMGTGRARTPTEIARLCADAGFTRTKLLRTPVPLAASAMLAFV